MNIFTTFIPEGPTYFKLFRIAYFDNTLSSFWKIIFMSPTGILIILTLLHIVEPKSSGIRRNHLALAGIFGFILYLFIYGLMYLATSLALDAGNFLKGSMPGHNYQSEELGLLDMGWSSFLYPILFLSYVLIHRFMKYEAPEVNSNYRTISRSKKPKTFKDKNDFV